MPSSYQVTMQMIDEINRNRLLFLFILKSSRILLSHVFIMTISQNSVIFHSVEANLLSQRNILQSLV